MGDVARPSLDGHMGKECAMGGRTARPGSASANRLPKQPPLRPAGSLSCRWRRSPREISNLTARRKHGEITGEIELTVTPIGAHSNAKLCVLSETS
jgi:hypothetical protein